MSPATTRPSTERTYGSGWPTSGLTEPEGTPAAGSAPQPRPGSAPQRIGDRVDHRRVDAGPVGSPGRGASYSLSTHGGADPANQTTGRLSPARSDRPGLRATRGSRPGRGCENGVMPDDEPDGRSFEDVARALADEVHQAVERLSTLDLDQVARAANEEAERARRWIEDLARSLAPTGDAARSPEDAPVDHAGPHPRAMPTTEQGVALAALESGRRWPSRPRTRGPSPPGRRALRWGRGRRGAGGPGRPRSPPPRGGPRTSRSGCSASFGCPTGSRPTASSR